MTLTAGAKAVGCKWVYKIKFNSNGTMERHKARLVAKGYTQMPGFDFQETLNAVAKHTTVRTFLAFTAIHGWYLL